MKINITQMIMVCYNNAVKFYICVILVKIKINVQPVTKKKTNINYPKVILVNITANQTKTVINVIIRKNNVKNVYMDIIQTQIMRNSSIVYNVMRKQPIVKNVNITLMVSQFVQMMVKIKKMPNILKI